MRDWNNETTDKCKHGIRDIEINLPYCRSCDFESWLDTKPEIVRLTALRFPLGTRFRLHGQVAHVISYSELGGISVTYVNPADDYERALDNMVAICPCCLDRLEALKMPPDAQRPGSATGPTTQSVKMQTDSETEKRQPGSLHPAGSAIPRRPWLLSKQYSMTFVLSQDNEIIIGDTACKYLGDDVLGYMISAVNAYSPNK